MPGYRPGFSAVAECRYGILQYLPDEPLVGDSLGWYGEYLQSQLDLLTGLTRPGATVLEVGAGVGAHALALAAALAPEGHLLLYESRPVFRRILEQNLAANRVGNVTLMRGQLGGGRASVPIFEGLSPTQTMSLGADMVPETVDDLQLEQLQLLKINLPLNGQEVTEGATDTLWRLRPVLFAASPDEAGLSDLVTSAKDHGYRTWRSEVTLFNPENFNRREEDIFGGRKALALLGVPEEAEVHMTVDGCIEL